MHGAGSTTLGSSHALAAQDIDDAFNLPCILPPSGTELLDEACQAVDEDDAQNFDPDQYHDG